MRDRQGRRHSQAYSEQVGLRGRTSAGGAQELRVRATQVRGEEPPARSGGFGSRLLRVEEAHPPRGLVQPAGVGFPPLPGLAPVSDFPVGVAVLVFKHPFILRRAIKRSSKGSYDKGCNYSRPHVGE